MSEKGNEVTVPPLNSLSSSVPSGANISKDTSLSQEPGFQVKVTASPVREGIEIVPEAPATYTKHY
jgi:hypothetical protein